MACRVLFLCTGNSARSILCEATLNQLGRGRFQAHSAGSRPTGVVNPHALAQLRASGIPTEGLRSKPWDEFAAGAGPALDLVMTVCDSAAQEPCPVVFGEFLRAHWSLPDPAGVQGAAADVAQAFSRVHEVITARLQALVDLPVDTLSAQELHAALARIALHHPAPVL